VTECDLRKPENALQFFPTTDPWTWSKKDNPKIEKVHRYNMYRPSQGSNRMDFYHSSQRNGTYQPGQMVDSYCPRGVKELTHTDRPSQQMDSYRPGRGTVMRPFEGH
jgi:hypothetical protein